MHPLLQPFRPHSKLDPSSHTSALPDPFSAPHLSCSFTMSLTGAELIQDCTIELTIGRRYGLLGQNGSGKSNFLKCLAAREVRTAREGAWQRGEGDWVGTEQNSSRSETSSSASKHLRVTWRLFLTCLGQPQMVVKAGEIGRKRSMTQGGWQGGVAPRQLPQAACL